jgi:protein TonB
MFARVALALPIGVGLTMALLFLMHAMIAAERGKTDLQTSARIVDFVRIERTEVIATREQRPDRPEAPEQAPSMPKPATAEQFSSEIKVAMAGPKLGVHEAEIGGLNYAVSDGEYVPLVKVAPRYPIRAAQRRLEGYVIVEFVVTTSGAVRDVRVIESTSELFEEAAIEAASKFKYKPRVVDGQPIEVSGVKNKITFKLDA